MKKRIVLISFIFSFVTSVFSTHERAGEITYRHISGNTYEITVTTYTRQSSIGADRCELVVFFGDGDSATFQRTNGTSINIDGDPYCPYYGEPLINDTKKNTYVGTHTYAGTGNYIITMNDDNRNENILNIPHSVDKPFSLRTELIINPFLGLNNSPVLLNPPIDNACIGRCFYHNPEAYDIDGDSLSYSLVSCYADGVPIIGWTLPANVTIDALKGTVSWCSPPPPPGLYNIAILIQEYRRLPGSPQRYYIGSILRDMQIEVKDCVNHPPQVNANDTCVVAGSNLHFQVTGTDPDVGESITLTATGGVFILSPAATFPTSTSFSPVHSTFNWNPTCKQVQLLPYSVLFKVEDNNSDPLAGYKSIFIKVIAPAPTALTATPSGTSIILNWNSAACNDTLGNNPFIGYTVYKKLSCAPWVHGVCETGASSSGYTKIGTTLPLITTFTDNNNGRGLSYGIDYSYLIVANYTDGAQSYASTSVCAKLVRDVPVITNVSVLSTGTNDNIWIHWIPPIADANNLDTIADPPPYEVRLMQAQGASPSASSFTQVASYNYTSFGKMTDTGFVSTGLNTRDYTYSYRVDFYSNGSFVGSSNVASSVYLSSLPDDHKLTLSWQATVPWINYKYYIYKETFPNSSVFNLLDSTSATSYTDSGLVNRVTYCYKVVSVGQFSDTTIIHPLYNNSQIKCDAPIDKTPPCQPTITTINGDCETATTTFTWTNPNISCQKPYGGDVLKYCIYFAPTDVDALQLIDSVKDINITTYVLHYLYEGKIPSVAGCYAVTAIDSSGNESPIVTKECIDNCPVYDLPNVFSPNGDEVNDLYKSLVPYRYIRDVNIKIYNRWGTKLFETTNPDVLWDGKNMETKKLCPDGVYYYVCVVNEIRLKGIVPHVLKNFIHLVSENKY